MWYLTALQCTCTLYSVHVVLFTNTKLCTQDVLDNGDGHCVLESATVIKKVLTRKLAEYLFVCCTSLHVGCAGREVDTRLHYNWTSWAKNWLSLSLQWAMGGGGGENPKKFGRQESVWWAAHSYPTNWQSSSPPLPTPLHSLGIHFKLKGPSFHSIIKFLFKYTTSFLPNLWLPKNKIFTVDE